MSVRDNGRGMPVDRHKGENVSGVEVILTRLHAGGKFSGKNYTFSGGLHGVGVSVVNALSLKLEVTVRRGGKEYSMTFAGGEPQTELKETGTVGARNTGTAIRFWPDPQYFDTVKFQVSRFKRLLRAKAVLCSGLTINFTDETDSGNDESWCFENGMCDYLVGAIDNAERVPDPPFDGHVKGNDEEVDWVVTWLGDGDEIFAESYVNLIPTAQGGTHVSGFRSGLTEAIREFCDFRDLTPKGVRITPEDVWNRATYLLSVRLKEPQFNGQTKERLSSREAATFVSGVVKDSFSLWLNQHVEQAEQIARIAIDYAQRRMRAGRQVKRKKITTGPALPGKLADCSSQDLERTELFLVEGDSAGGSAKQARDKEFQAIMPLRGKILNTWEVESNEVLGSQEVHDIAVALGVDPGGSSDFSKLRYGKVCVLADADSDGAHIATLLCALFIRHFRPLVEAGRVCIAMPPLYRIDVGKNVYYALDENEKKGVLDKLAADGVKGKVNVQRFKGLGEMNPLQLRETTMAPDTRRLVRLEIGDVAATHGMMDMLLAKKRSADRRKWLSENGDQIALQ
ncbi:MAG: DNA topoisomerase 4 subunit B [marine bacterium B5-7]|nr:MAG: DNA topoisomerase 4 subunit B [marine bacterium B5-7]